MTDSKKILLKAQNISLSLSSHSVLQEVHLNLFEKDIYALLGANGAGKTTLFKVFAGLLWPSGGFVELFENTITPLRKKDISRIGFLIGNPPFYEFLTARQHLEFVLSLKKFGKTSNIDETLQKVGLEKRSGERISRYSDGMKQRLAIAQALLGNPKILILDEPFRGLDSIGIQDVWRLLLELNRDHSMTILFSSHVISIADTHANRIGIIHHGKMLSEGKKDQLTSGSKDLEKAYLELIHSQTSIAFENGQT